MWIKTLLILIGFLFLISCSTNVNQESNNPEVILIPTNNSNIQTTATPFQPKIIPTPTEKIINLYVPDNIQARFKNAFNMSGVKTTSLPENANCSITSKFENLKIGEYIYSLVAPFNTITDEISRNDLIQIFNGDSSADLSGVKILISKGDFELLNQKFDFNQTNFVVAEPENMISIAYQSSKLWAIIPFDQIKPAWKVIGIDGISPFDQVFNSRDYFLTVPMGISCLSSNDHTSFTTMNLPTLTNRENDKFTSVLITGTTALTRATGAKMELYGNDYPGEAIKQWFDEADISHISNEVSFTTVCPHADPNQKDLFFCSRPEYADLFDFLGVDVIELTGNHLVDKGTQPLNDTFDLLSAKGIPYYAAGRTVDEAEKAVRFDINGNKIAFIGCNEAGPNFVWVADQRSGVIRCDFDRMAQLVSDLKGEGYLPIVTYQYWETAQFKPMPYQRDDSIRMIDAGAVIVSGSQSHLPMSMEVYKNGFIHYGLGNLFFDQMDIPFPGTRREFLDRHIFYDGKYLGTQIYTAMLEDYAQPRPMTLSERQMLLRDAFVDFRIDY